MCNKAETLTTRSNSYKIINKYFSKDDTNNAQNSIRNEEKNAFYIFKIYFASIIYIFLNHRKYS